jgi:hypothetical protein
MKRTTILIVSVLVAAYSFAQTVVPDANFRSFLNSKYNIQFDILNNIIPSTVVDTMTLMDVGYQNIADIKGIEAFKNLKTFVCAGNHLQNIDLSKNTSIRRLDVSNNNLSKIDLSAITELRAFNCGANPFDSLDLRNQKNLFDFYCNVAPKLSSINIGKKDSLVDIWVSSTIITHIDVSGCSNLKVLACSDNKLKSLNVSKNPLLEYISFKNNELDSIDLSGIKYLTNFECGGNKLTKIDISKMSNLMMFNCANNLLQKLNVTQNTKLFYLDCSYNQLTSLDLVNCRNLNNIDISYNNNLTRCYVWTIPFGQVFGQMIKITNTPVNYFMFWNVSIMLALLRKKALPTA